MSADQYEHFQSIARMTDLEGLLHLSVIDLSNGQSRRARIAKSLIRCPQILLLDEPFTGLDAQNRQRLVSMLGLIKESGRQQIVLSLREHGLIPESVTHVAKLGIRGSVCELLSADSCTVFDVKRAGQENPRRSESVIERIEREQLQKHGNQQQQKEKVSSGCNNESFKREDRFGSIVNIRNLNCSYFGRPILSNINWNIEAGDRWVLMGPNGSGKTTLLAMITGDHPKSYANDITLFGRRRGTGESLFEIKSKIGHSSPELLAQIPRSWTGRQLIESAFSETLVLPSLSTDERQQVKAITSDLALDDLVDHQLFSLTAAQRRLLLFARALVRRCPLIILDEPFQGMDAPTIERCKRYLSKWLSGEQALILVSHYEEDLPDFMTHVMRLSENKPIIKS